MVESAFSAKTLKSHSARMLNFFKTQFKFCSDIEKKKIGEGVCVTESAFSH